MSPGGGSVAEPRGVKVNSPDRCLYIVLVTIEFGGAAEINKKIN